MQIPQKYSQFLDQEALIVVIGKGHGIIYHMKDGVIEQVDELEKQTQSFTDNEGFFFRSAHGQQLGSGAPRETDDSEYIKRFGKSISAELDKLIKQESPRALYVFEPEYVKGRIVDFLQKHPELVIHTVRHGNYVKEHPETLLKYITDFLENKKVENNQPEDFARDLRKST